MLFILLALVVGKHVLLAKLSSAESHAGLASFAAKHGATIEPLDTYSKRGLYFRLSGNSTAIADSTTDEFTVEAVAPYVSHTLDPYIAFATEEPYVAQDGPYAAQYGV